MNKLKQMSNIIQFEQDAMHYYDLAIENAENDDYCAAIKYVRKAIAKDPACLDYRLFMAELYSAMGRNIDSNNTYFKILCYNEEISECYIGLAQNFLLLDEYELAAKYLELSLPYHDNTDDMEIDYDAIFKSLPKKENQLKLVSNEKDYSSIFMFAKFLIERGDFKNAIKILQFVSPEADCYYAAVNNLALCYNSLKDYDSALKILLDPHNQIDTLAMINLVIAYKGLGDNDNAEYYINQILNANVKDNSENLKIAHLLLTYQKLNLAEQYLIKYLSVCSYDVDAITLLGILYYNNGKIDDAKNCMLKNLDIDDSNTVAKYYNQYFHSPKNLNKKPLNYSTNVPRAERSKRAKKIQEMCFWTDEQLRKQLEKDNDFFALLKWFLTEVSFSPVHINILSRLTQIQNIKIEYFFRESLVDATYSNLMLKALLIEYLYTRPQFRIAIVLDDVIKFLYPKFPKELGTVDDIFVESYINVFAAFSFTNQGFEKKLSTIMKKIIKAAKEKNLKFKSSNALSATIAHLYGGGVFDDKRIVAGMFNTTKTTVNNYINQLAIKSGSNKLKQKITLNKKVKTD